MRHHIGAPPEPNSDSSSDEDDAFSAFNRKKPKKGKSINGPAKSENYTKNEDTHKARDIHKNFGEPSSKKRYHFQSNTRGAKMDALLQELQETSTHVTASSTDRAPLEKMGSFVTPDEEPFTTNIFVGNLAPVTTEEELTEIFRQFGDLYSVKIMWPRTPEERARGRNTGFVCFMKRQDAEVAMSTYQDSDPLNTGRCMCLGWGKNMKKMVKKGGAGVIRGKRQIYSGSGDPNENGDKRLKNPDEPESYSGLPGQEKTSFSKQSKAVVETPVYDPSKHTASAIRVIAPADPRRLKFITTIASFVAKDGSVLEELLRTRKSSDANFAFLQEHNDATDRVRTEERIFYRWRVFSFTQGDGINSWRTEPFVMVLPNGRFWIPPPLDAKAALLEEMKREEQEIMIRSQVETRRKMSIQKGFMTGRQLERTRHGALVGAAKLNNDELKEWEDILMNRLCSSRESICEAMAFSIEKSGAALHISDLLKKALLDDRRGVSIETRIARLYLMSDILFNSQQPGVKNAFRYRDAIEAMSPEIFRNFGQHGNGKAGRITMNKLGKAVSTVLRAWTSWSVYNPNFLEELQAAFEGKTTDAIKVAESESMSNGNAESIVSTEKEEEPCTEEIQLSAEVVMPQTEWTDAKDAEDDSNQPDDFNEIQTNDDIAMDGEPLEDDDIDSAELIDEEVDGVSLRHSEIDYGSFSDED